METGSDLADAWRVVMRSPDDFDAWTRLLQQADKTENIEEIKKAYNTFLTEYPLCYMYWYNFAKAVEEKEGIQEALEIYRKGVTKGVPHSIDLWNFYTSAVIQSGAPVEEVRSLFEEALAVVGTDFTSHSIWEAYIQFEEKEPKRVISIYQRALAVPLEKVVSLFEKYKKYIQDVDISQLPDAPSDLNGENAIREYFINTIQQSTYKNSLEESNKRRPFEYQIAKRPYFHVQPLEEADLENWKKYLTWEEENGTRDSIIKLYERALIPCANYRSIWTRYIKYMESIDVDKCREVFLRATGTFLKRDLNFLIDFALFEEQQGKVGDARNIYGQIQEREEGTPFLAGVIAHVNLERREKNFQTCIDLYKRALDEEGTEGNARAFLTAHFARFLFKVLGKEEEARTTFQHLAAKQTDNLNFWFSFIEFEKSCGGEGEEKRVLSLFNQAISDESKLKKEDKEALRVALAEYLRDFGTDVKLIRETRVVRDSISKNGKKRARSGNTTDTRAAKMPKITNAIAARPSYIPPSVAQQPPFNYYAYANAPNMNMYAHYQQQQQQQR